MANIPPQEELKEYELTQPIYYNCDHTNPIPPILEHDPKFKMLGAPIINKPATKSNKPANPTNKFGSDNTGNVGSNNEKEFWNCIAKLNWHDKDDGGNRKIDLKTFWTADELANVKLVSQKIFKNMSDRFKEQDWFGRNGIPLNEANKIICHIIARGKQIYDTVIDDFEFAHAYKNQHCGFYEMMLTLF